MSDGREVKRDASSSPAGAAVFVERLVAVTDADADGIDALAREAAMDHGFSAREELARPWGRVWVARHPNAELAAFLVAWHVADELHVLNVATAAAHRGRGVGTALLRAAFAYAAAEHVRIVLLEVRRSNRQAIRLYRRLGFTAMGVRPGYYADNGEDAIEMVVALDPATGAALPGRDEIRIDVGGDRG
ncbi:MAG TPA: ribosomal protein S18-alanine N-acetyltransferase [Minicystis sp.]|nr:ribosomal protein S18-alanine N-acetyltransferase [Minicystis sp.]